jgi:hypothetical protein
MKDLWTEAAADLVVEMLEVKNEEDELAKKDPLSILNFDEVPLNPLPKINMDLRK